MKNAGLRIAPVGGLGRKSRKGQQHAGKGQNRNSSELCVHTNLPVFAVYNIAPFFRCPSLAHAVYVGYYSSNPVQITD